MRKKRSCQPLLPVLACSLCLILPLKSQAANWQWVQTGTRLQYMDLDNTALDHGMLRSTFQTIKGQTYYFDADGSVHTGWLYLKKGTYFFRSNGTMVKNQWVGNYYFTKSGKMAKNRWIGSFAKKEWLCIRGHWYYFYSNGYMATERKIGKYYVNKKGQMVINRWVRVGKYRLHYGPDGKVNKKIRVKT